MLLVGDCAEALQVVVIGGRRAQRAAEGVLCLAAALLLAQHVAHVVPREVRARRVGAHRAAEGAHRLVGPPGVGVQVAEAVEDVAVRRRDAAAALVRRERAALVADVDEDVAQVVVDHRDVRARLRVPRRLAQVVLRLGRPPVGLQRVRQLEVAVRVRRREADRRAQLLL